MASRVRQPLLIVVALIAGLLSPAIGASAALAQDPPPGVGIRLVDAPVATADNPRARVYIIDHVRPPAVIERRVEVSNGTDSTQEIAIYPAAAEIRRGTFIGAEGRTDNELSRWITVDPSERELAPGERTMVNVTIEVPPDATRGEHYGVVWAEMVTPPEGAGGVTQVSRVGVRIYLSVGRGGMPPTDFEVDSLTAARDDEGTPLVRATVRNTGRRALDLGGELTLEDGPGGISAGPFTADPGTTVGLGQSAPLTVVLDEQLPAGPWRAHLTVTSGFEERSAEATITFPDRATAAPAVPAQPSGGIPWWVIAGLALFLLLLDLGLLLWLLLARRRSRDPVEAT